MIIDNFDTILGKFNYCSMTNSLYQDATVIEDGVTPERMYRNALLNWHSIAGALRDTYYGNEKNVIELRRKEIQLQDINKKLSKARGNKRELLLLDKKSIELDIHNIETSMKLNAPLIKDAINRLKFYQEAMDKLEPTLRPYELAEEEYHTNKVLINARAERLARDLGIDKGTVLYAASTGVDLSEFLSPTDTERLVSNGKLCLSERITTDRKCLPGYDNKLLIVIPKLNNDIHYDISVDIELLKSYIPCELVFINGNIIDNIYHAGIIAATNMKARYILYLHDSINISAEQVIELYNSVSSGHPVVCGNYGDMYKDMQGVSDYIGCIKSVPYLCMLIDVLALDNADISCNVFTLHDFITMCNDRGNDIVVQKSVRCDIDYSRCNIECYVE